MATAALLVFAVVGVVGAVDLTGIGVIAGALIGAGGLSGLAAVLKINRERKREEADTDRIDALKDQITADTLIKVNEELRRELERWEAKYQVEAERWEARYERREAEWKVRLQERDEQIAELREAYEALRSRYDGLQTDFDVLEQRFEQVVLRSENGTVA